MFLNSSFKSHHFLLFLWHKYTTPPTQKSPPPLWLTSSTSSSTKMRKTSAEKQSTPNHPTPRPPSPPKNRNKTKSNPNPAKARRQSSCKKRQGRKTWPRPLPSIGISQPNPNKFRTIFSGISYRTSKAAKFSIFCDLNASSRRSPRYSCNSHGSSNKPTNIENWWCSSKPNLLSLSKREVPAAAGASSKSGAKANRMRLCTSCESTAKGNKEPNSS